MLGFGFLVAHLATGVGGHSLDHFADRWVYDGLEVLAATGCLMRATLVRAERVAWGVLGFGMLSFALGDICFDFVYGGSPPTPSLADVFYLGFYPCCYIALVLLFKSRISAFDRSLWLDGLIAALACAAVSASVVLEGVLRNTRGNATTVAVNLAYPVADLVLMALVVFVFAINGFRPGRTWATVAGAFALMSVADSIFLYLSATGRYSEGTMLDALWPAAMLLLAASAWQRVERGPPVRLEGRFLDMTPLVGGLAALGVLIENRFEPHNVMADLLAAGAILVVLARMTLSFHDNLHLLQRTREQSLTDDLTGLANRRHLMLDLEREVGHSSREPMLLVIYDLNGFKHYNDSFGHPSGDLLLRRLAARLADAAGGHGTAYRLGGDEFCLLVALPGDGGAALIEQSVRALGETDTGFPITACYGAVALPEEASDASGALRLADERLYAQKRTVYGRRGTDKAARRGAPELDSAEVEHPTALPGLSAVAGRSQ